MLRRTSAPGSGRGWHLRAGTVACGIDSAGGLSCRGRLAAGTRDSGRAGQLGTRSVCRSRPMRSADTRTSVPTSTGDYGRCRRSGVARGSTDCGDRTDRSRRDRSSARRITRRRVNRISRAPPSGAGRSSTVTAPGPPRARARSARLFILSGASVPERFGEDERVVARLDHEVARRVRERPRRRG